MLYELFLAARYLKPRRNAVSLITLTSILGVTLGVMVLMVVMAVMSGFTGEMKAKLIETQSHFQVYSRYPLVQSEVDRITSVMKNQQATGTPVIQSPVLVQYQLHTPQGTIQKLDTQCMLFAASQESLEEHLGLDKYIKEGKLLLPR